MSLPSPLPSKPHVGDEVCVPDILIGRWGGRFLAHLIWI